MTTESLQTLFIAICAVESGLNPSVKDGAAGEVGVAQITQICLDDVNRILDVKLGKGHGPRFTSEDRRDPAKAFEIFRLYTTYYGGPDATDEQRSRTWSGGPDGPREKCTRPYWLKVESRLEALNSIKMDSKAFKPPAAEAVATRLETGRKTPHSLE